MTDDEIYGKLTEIMKDTFGLSELTIDGTTTAPDVENWDSLSNVRLILAIEMAFGLRFSSFEVSGNDNVGELVQQIQSKLQN